MAEVAYRAAADSATLVGGGRGGGQGTWCVPNRQGSKSGIRQAQAARDRIASSGRRTAPLAAPRTAFMELLTPGPGSGAECVIELEGPRGKMRIQWKGSTTPDLAELSRVLWESA